jgi:spoIIIJ-associated protein
MEAHNPSAEHTIESQLKSLEAVLRAIVASSPFKLTFSIQKATPHPGDPDTPEYIVDFSGPDADLLLEMNATLLHAFEHVLLKAIRLDDDHLPRIAFDCKDWRRTRIGELQLMAQVAAERVIDTGQPFILNPMNARERRIIHLALKDRPQVQTQSEGMGPERKVVIFPKK